MVRCELLRDDLAFDPATHLLIALTACVQEPLHLLELWLTKRYMREIALRSLMKQAANAGQKIPLLFARMPRLQN